MIIYIHGFGSSGEANKANIFREYFKSIDENLIAPSLSYVPSLAIKTLEELISSYNEDIYLIGSSLGGFYSTYLSLNNKVKRVILINPAVSPNITLKRSLGNSTNFYDNSTYSWNENHLSMLDNYTTKDIDTSKFMVLLQMGDETLNYNDAVVKYKNANIIIEEGGNHSFKNIQNHFTNIKDFFEK